MPATVKTPAPPALKPAPVKHPKAKTLYERWERYKETYDVEISMASTFALEATEPDTMLAPLDCLITVAKWDPGGGESADAKPAGHIEAYLLGDDKAPALSGFSRFDILDAHSQEMSDFILLLDADGYLSGDVLEQFDSPLTSYMLILHKAQIQPAFRHLGLGLLAARRLIELFGSGCLVAYKPYPLQFSECADKPGFSEALRKVERYWAKLGSEPITAAPGLWGLSTEAHPLISIEEMLK